MPQPNMNLIQKSINRLIQEEISYDILALRKEHEVLLAGLNSEPKKNYDSIMQAIANQIDGFFFFLVYGHGKNGKTHL